MLPALESEGQTSRDIQQLKQSFIPAQNVVIYPFAEKETPSEYFWILSKMFLFYKKNISSQDLNACNFHPSCSEYAMISVREMGPVAGVLNGFDRLTRCHPWAKKYYSPDLEKKKLSDPWIQLRHQH
jgi:putative component of membrane protein insertase Oxa1/YidC/SpoIIIJ protein YidD